MFLMISEILSTLSKLTMTKFTTFKELNVNLKTYSDKDKFRMLPIPSEIHKLNSRAVKSKKLDLKTNLMSMNKIHSLTKNTSRLFYQ